MKIGIIGVPEVGKSELAKGLGTGVKGSVSIVDDYVEAIGEESGIALGIFAAYPGNLAISTGRMMREFNARKDDVVITVGTDIDTMMYAAVDSLNMVNLARNDTEKDLILERSRTLMKILAFMFIDCGRYDHLFYLPQTKKTEDWKAQLDENIPQALKLYGVAYTTLEGTPEERLEQALTKINDIRDESQAAETAKAN